MTAHVDETLQALVEKAAGAGIQLSTAAGIGVPHEVLADHVERSNTDLLIVGTHGRTGVRRALLGSVAERLIGTMTCDVLAVPTPS
jgi:nucleotide-binding universal stress UspA family protein